MGGSRMSIGGRSMRGAIDSWATRLTVQPGKNWSGQVFVCADCQSGGAVSYGEPGADYGFGDVWEAAAEWELG